MDQKIKKWKPKYGVSIFKQCLKIQLQYDFILKAMRDFQAIPAAPTFEEVIKGLKEALEKSRR